jgi:hypothetical protein
MKITDIEKLNQLISRTDMSGNEKVKWLTDFIDKHVMEQLTIPVVVRQSEQLFCPKCGMHERIIGCSVHDYLCNDCGNVWSK